MRIKPLIVLGIIALSCNNLNQQPPKAQFKILVDSVKYTPIADTITYDVVIKNPEKEDQWAESCLKGFKRGAFIDTLFNDIYNSKLTAYDFFTKQTLTNKEVKKLETQAGYSRGIIGKFQFNEEWQYNREKQSMVKKVHSIVFGYETYASDGFVKGYKPLFIVYLN